MMRPGDLLKLATSGKFYVLKVSRESGGKYVLKRMCRYVYPAWETISRAERREDLQFDIDLHSGSMFVLVVPGKPALRDLDNMKEAGFRVLRKADGEKLSVKEYDGSTRRWKILGRFASAGAREDFLRELLADHRTVLVD